ncbi:hypothetical protein PRIPAC_81797 [Pristionchus pacificus]|uniref:Uncharacterized protein n=1 Tax=Pristionchus pacificus TaxID=54126 RepID=A0A2A6CKN9_PRIPA|nr:hypothetical protein PRIPAC_81797 [Pristionchus pacificus]|eukprot:PDM78670.1 hypothetical protein PRIPAC_31249 [Pristionchus pacificus]
MNHFILVVFVIVSVRAAEWSAWTETPDSPCSDICGYCGVRVTAVRNCSELYKCFGIAQKYEECAPTMCRFPRNTCCAGYVKGVVGKEFQCVAASATMKAKTKLS